MVVRAAAEKGAFWPKKKRTASDTELKQITLTTDTAGEARCKALCAKKGKGPRNLPMDEATCSTDSR